jgi:hypothetical protein
MKHFYEPVQARHCVIYVKWRGSGMKLMYMYSCGDVLNWTKAVLVQYLNRTACTWRALCTYCSQSCNRTLWRVRGCHYGQLHNYNLSQPLPLHFPFPLYHEGNLTGEEINSYVVLK